MMHKIDPTNEPIFLEDYLMFTKEVLEHELKKLKVVYKENYDIKDDSLVKTVFEVHTKLSQAVESIDETLKLERTKEELKT